MGIHAFKLPIVYIVYMAHYKSCYSIYICIETYIYIHVCIYILKVFQQTSKSFKKIFITNYVYFSICVCLCVHMYVYIHIYV